jgi:hypothetical protein
MINFHTPSKFVVVGVNGFPNTDPKCTSVLDNKFYGPGVSQPLRRSEFRFLTKSGITIHSSDIPTLAENIKVPRSRLLGILDVQLSNNSLSGKPSLESQFDPSYLGSVIFAERVSVSNRLNDSRVEPEENRNIWNLEDDFRFVNGPLEVSTGLIHHSVNNSTQLLEVVTKSEHIEKFPENIMTHVGFYLVRASVLKPQVNGILKLNFD